MDSQTLGILIAAPFILLIIGIRIWRGSRERRLRIERMWIGPVIFLVVIAAAVLSLPPPPFGPVYAGLAAAFVVGLAIGWLRGRMVRVTIDVDTHALSSRSSPWGMLVFVALLGARVGLRYVIGANAEQWHISATALTDGFLLFYGGMIVGMRLEVWLRARKLLSDAIAARAAGKTVEEFVSEEHAGAKPTSTASSPE